MPSSFFVRCHSCAPGLQEPSLCLEWGRTFTTHVLVGSLSILHPGILEGTGCCGPLLVLCPGPPGMASGARSPRLTLAAVALGFGFRTHPCFNYSQLAVFQRKPGCPDIRGRPWL